MGCIFYFFAWPFYLMYYMIRIAFEIIKIIVIFTVEIIALFKGTAKSNYSTTYNTNYSHTKNDSKAKKTQKLSWQEEEFEREADLWGLSQEDRRIAKEERMSPADFIEAEERDDDELFTDEWEN